MEKVAHSAQNRAERNRKKKLVVAGAALVGFSLAAIGGYATLTSDAWVTSGPFSSAKTEKVNLLANGQKRIALKGLSYKDMKPGDQTGAEKVELSNDGNVDIARMDLKASFPTGSYDKALAEVIDLEFTNEKDGKTVTKSMADLVSEGLNLHMIGLDTLKADKKSTGNITVKAVMSKRASEKQAGMQVSGLSLRFIGQSMPTPPSETPDIPED
ncbi:TasA family protein [Streptomyces sp. NPDC057011]|uniref:TasA family protein n=1 Tax=unclassified Streptomyces TaxID=2593676 RepID=UPI0036383676